jgi:hypothetical protein
MKQKYYKRYWSEVIIRFNKDWSATDCYYFAVSDDNYAVQQIKITDEGKVYKHDQNNLQDVNGGLAEGSLELDDEQYIALTKAEFDALWNRSFTNRMDVKNIRFDEHWKMAWYNLNYNTNEQDLKDKGLIFCGTYKDIYCVNVEYLVPDNFFRLNVAEGTANLRWTTTDTWDEMAKITQLWVDYIEENTDRIYSRSATEKLERPAKVLIGGVLQDALFTTWRNMDWEIEKFRGVHLNIGKTIYSKINTYTNFEDLMLSLQESLPENIRIQNCFFCRYSNYAVWGNDNFGDLNCFKHTKQKCISAKNKHDIIDLFETEAGKYLKVEESFYCDDFAAITEMDFNYKSTKV